MKLFPLLILLLFIPPIHFSEDMVHHTYKIDKLTYNDTIYCYGNLTINDSNQSILSNYTLIFTSPGIHHLTLNGYLKSCNLIIMDYSGFLNILVYNSTIKFYNFSLQINGNFTSYNSSITFIKSDIGNEECSPAQEFYDSKIQIIKSEIYPPNLKSINCVVVGRYIQNGQPISKNGSYDLNKECKNLHNIPITSVEISFNYTLIQNETDLNLAIPDYNVKINTHLFKNNTTFSDRINFNQPINSKVSQSISMKFNFSEKTQLSVKNSVISLISNCSVKFYDFAHNNIILNNSNMTSISSQFMFSFNEKVKNGFLNDLFKGIIGNKISKLTFMNTSFPLWDDKQDLPISLKFNSSFKFYKLIKVSFLFGNKSIIPKIKFNVSKHSLITNGGTYLCYFSKYNNITVFHNIWNFTAGKIIKYLSFKKYEFSTGNSSFIYSFKNYSSINISYYKSRYYNTFIYEVYLSQSGKGDPKNVIIRLQNKSCFVIPSISENKTIERTITVDLEKTKWLNFSLSYFNGICNISFNEISEKIFKHTVKSANSKVRFFTVLFENQSYYSSHDSIVIYNTEKNITFKIYGTGFYRPLNSCIITNESCLMVNFSLMRGRIYFNIQNLRSLPIIFNGTKINVKQCEYLCEEYGNYTLKYFNGYCEKKINIYLNSSDLYIYLQYNNNNRSILVDIIPSIIIFIVIIAYVRIRFISICPTCQKRIKFLERHRNHQL